jgi:hydrogenase maturation factor
MPRTGKISRAFFREHIAPQLGANRAETALGPQHGVDFGVLDIGGQALAVATDPVSILPGLGFERAGRFAVRIVLADVAVSGLDPSHLAVGFTLPPDLSDDDFAAVWGAIHDECAALGVDIVTGHTARYAGCSFPWVGAATAMAVGDHDAIVRPDGARVGDDLIITTGPAVEAAALFASLFPNVIDCDDDRLARVAAMLDTLGVVRDTRAIAEIDGVSAMHDITEGGLLGACHEMAAGADTRFRVDTDRVPIDDDVAAVCSTLDMNPWRATSSGSLLLAVDPDATNDVLAALRDRGTTAAVIGSVESGSVASETRVVRDGEPTEPPVGDSSWPVYERLLAAANDADDAADADPNDAN